MKKFVAHLLIVFVLASCSNAQSDTANFNSEIVDNAVEPDFVKNIIDTSANKISTRFNVPKGYKRTRIDTSSFKYYLRHLPLKKHGSLVYTYDSLYSYNYAHDAVLDIDIGDKDLQQCADAIMRLKAEYHYKKAEYDAIHFNFTNGFRVDYNKWKDGFRIGSNYKSWYKKTSPDSSYQNFRSYMDMIFMFAGTLSLSKELKPKDLSDIEIGDVFIYGGTPGHAVIIVDMAIHELTGERIFMMAQSYMPAQDIHVLKNIENESISPWYSSQIDNLLSTPSWTFESNELMSFR